MTTRVAQRFSLVIFTFALAAAIPRLDLFISLVGAVSISTLAMMVVIDSVTQGEKCSWKRLFKNVTLFSLGFLGFFTGSFVSIRNIINHFIGQDKS